MFVPGRPFQPRLKFANKTKAYPSKAPLRYSTQEQAPVVTQKHYTRLEKPAKSKTVQLIGNIHKVRRKTVFFNTAPWPYSQRYIFFVTYKSAQCMSLPKVSQTKRVKSILKLFTEGKAQVQFMSASYMSMKLLTSLARSWGHLKHFEFICYYF